MPDVVWDWDIDKDRHAVEDNGYVIAYRQEGGVARGSKWFPGRPIRAREFIAVKGKWADVVRTGAHGNFAGGV